MENYEAYKAYEREHRGKGATSVRYQGDYLSNSKGKSLSMPSFPLFVIGFIFLYALFALDRIKSSFSFFVEGRGTTNEIWLIPLLCLLIYFNKKGKSFGSIDKNNLFFITYIFIYLFIIAVGGFHINSVTQFIYAVLLFVVPMFVFFPMSRLSREEIHILIKFFILICLIYASFAIILSTNYAHFMGLVGNNVENYQHYSQYRASMMLGSSISVSYYFNLTLPLCFYMYFTSNKKTWRIISALSIIVITVATFVLLSRLASLCTLFIVAYCLFFIKGKKKKGSRKIGVVFLITIASVYAYQNYDLTRILDGLSFSRSSDVSRLEASSLGVYIFTQYPVFGSGMASFFERVYDDRWITVDGLSGLIDPHNMYVLLLSELGLAGFAVTILLLGHFFKRFSNIREEALRRTAYITLLAFLLDAMGGSHLFNEISFATVFWIYIGLFNAISIKDANNVPAIDKVIK